MKLQRFPNVSTCLVFLWCTILMNWIQGYWYVVEICTLCTLRWKKKTCTGPVTIWIVFAINSLYSYSCHSLVYKLRLICLWGIRTVISFWGSILCGLMFLLVPVLTQRFSPGYLVFLPPQKSSFQVLNLTQKTSFRYASMSAGVW